jgi:hypothetical protein
LGMVEWWAPACYLSYLGSKNRKIKV